MPPINALYIKSKHEPYRRAGFEHSRQGFGVALELLTEEQIAVLKNDPHLVVEECTFPSDEDLAAEEAAKAEAEKAAAEAAAAEEARVAQIAADELAAAEKAETKASKTKAGAK